MTRPSVMQDERLVELLVRRATEGLSATEDAELQRLLQEKDYVDADRFDDTASALMLAGRLEQEPLPNALRDRLLKRDDAKRPNLGGRFAWLALAASVLIAIVGWWPRLQRDADVDLVTEASPDMSTLRQRRAALLKQEGTMLREWKATEDPVASGVRGDVIWHSGAQMGYMRFSGLAPNDARTLQYQLWIFDTARGDRYPVDGGVFNIPAGETDVVVPIIAKLPVREPAMFAVTIEKPGGAVVSSRERIVVLAPVASAG